MNYQETHWPSRASADIHPHTQLSQAFPQDMWFGQSHLNLNKQVDSGSVYWLVFSRCFCRKIFASWEMPIYFPGMTWTKPMIWFHVSPVFGFRVCILHAQGIGDFPTFINKNDPIVDKQISIHTWSVWLSHETSHDMFYILMSCIHFFAWYSSGHLYISYNWL